MKMLQTPVILHQLDGEPVQQFGVRGRIALRPEVFGGGDEASPEIRLPDSIDDRAGCGRRLAVGEPLREGQPSRRGSCRQRVQERGRPRLNRLVRAQEVATIEHARHPRGLALVEHELC